MSLNLLVRAICASSASFPRRIFCLLQIGLAHFVLSPMEGKALIFNSKPVVGLDGKDKITALTVKVSDVK